MDLNATMVYTKTLERISMRRLFSLGTEGGPLLLADSAVAMMWQGIENDDYNRLCSRFDADLTLDSVKIEIGNGSGISWEMMGGGCADIFSADDGKIVVMRPWLHDPDTSDTRPFADHTTADMSHVGELEVPSKKLAIMWAPESGNSEFVEEFYEEYRSADHSVIGNSVFILKTVSDHYDCYTDTFTIDLGDARRLILVPR